jgi:hypothetical protein
VQSELPTTNNGIIGLWLTPAPPRQSLTPPGRFTRGAGAPPHEALVRKQSQPSEVSISLILHLRFTHTYKSSSFPSSSSPPSSKPHLNHNLHLPSSIYEPKQQNVKQRLLRRRRRWRLQPATELRRRSSPRTRRLSSTPATIPSSATRWLPPSTPRPVRPTATRLQPAWRRTPGLPSSGPVPSPAPRRLRQPRPQPKPPTTTGLPTTGRLPASGTPAARPVRCSWTGVPRRRTRG